MKKQAANIRQKISLDKTTDASQKSVQKLFLVFFFPGDLFVDFKFPLIHWRKWSSWVCTQNALLLNYINVFPICNYTKIIWENLCAIGNATGWKALHGLWTYFTYAGHFPEWVMVCNWIPGK